MNNDQFDNLTREFGKGISRRGAIKLLRVGILSVLFGQFAGDQTAILAAKELCPENNVVRGTCEDLAHCVNDIGVMCFGVRRTKAYGCTHADFYAKPHVENTTTCSDAQKIETCGMGFTGICLTAEVTATVTVDAQSTQFKFLPSAKLLGCDDQVKVYEAQIAEHEKQHRKDALSVRDQYSMNWSAGKHVYYSCGNDLEAAKADLKTKIEVAKLEVKQLEGKDGVMRTEWRRISCEYDNSPEGEHLTHPCKCDTCRPGSEKPPACGDQCCNECETCDPATNACVPICTEGQMCKGGVCVDIGDCVHCDINPKVYTYVSNCTACETCDLATGTCVPRCNACETCKDGFCADTCEAGTHCENGTCVTDCPTCDECMHCENGLCVRTCTDTEVCCGGQCIDPSQYNCCITSDNGSAPCLNGRVCCASGECCDPVFGQCCGGACVPYSPSSCTNCFPCSSPDQVCCTSGNGSVYGCCDANQICDPAHGCVAAPV